MTIVLPEIVSSLIFLTGKYESNVESIFRTYVKKGDIVVDIGAHFGYFSLLAGKLVGKSGKVYAFEPTHSTYEILQKNSTQHKNIIPINKAVYSKRAFLTLHDFGLQYGALNSFYEPRIKKPINFTASKVAAVSLDSYFAKLRRKPSFIKIDAESSEYSILQGMKNILLKNKPILCIEAGDMNIAGIKTSQEIVAFLIKKKYEAYHYRNNRLKKYNGESLVNQHVNLLFLPK
jgi:FkbM family methyltransferase